MAVDDKLAVLSDGDKRLMAVRIGADDEKALTEAAAAMTKNGLVSPIAVLGKRRFRRRFDRQPAEFRVAESRSGQVAGPGGAIASGGRSA